MEPKSLTVADSYGVLASRMAELKAYIEKKGFELKPFQDEYNELRQSIIPKKMEAEGITTVNVAGVGRVTCTTQMSISTTDPEGLQKWLQENGFEALIKPTVNASSLKSLIKECLEEGTEYPADYVEVSSFTQASLTKK